MHCGIFSPHLATSQGLSRETLVTSRGLSRETLAGAVSRDSCEARLRLVSRESREATTSARKIKNI